MHRVFISYSRKNVEMVRRLHGELEAQGVETWIDWEGIPPTAEWMQEIREAIESAEAVVVVLSPELVVSRVCGEEIEYAENHHKRLIPLQAADVVASSVRPAVAALNWIDCRPDKDLAAATRTLVQALETDLEWVKDHTRLLVRARQWEAGRKESSTLLRGRELDAMESRVTAETETDPRLTELQRRYLLESRRRATAVQRRRLAAVAFGMFVAVALAITAAIQREKSERRAGAALARRLVETKPMLALAHAVRETDRPFSRSVPEVRSSLLSALQMPKERAVLAVGEVNAGIRRPVRTVALGRGPVLAAILDSEFVGRPESQSIYLWDERGRCLPPVVTTSPILALAASASAEFVAAWTADGKVARLAVRGGSEVATDFEVPGQHDFGNIEFGGGGYGSSVSHYSNSVSAVHSVSMSRDGDRVAIGGSFGVIVQRWNEDAPLLGEAFNGESVSAVALAPGATVVLAVGFESGRICVLGADQKVEPLQCAGPVLALEFHPDDPSVLTSGDGSGQVTLWQLRGPRRSQLLIGHTDVVTSLAFSPGGRFLVSGSRDNSARIWETKSGMAVGPPLRGHDSWIRSVAFTGEGRVATASNDGSVRIWDVPDHLVALRITDRPGARYILATSESPRSVYFAREDGQVVRWCPESGFESVTPVERHSIALIAATRDGRMITTIETARDRDEESVLITVRDAELSVLDQWNVPEPPKALAISPDGSAVAVARHECAEVVNWRTDHVVRTPTGHVLPIESLAFSNSGSWLASGSQDNSVQLWSVETGEAIGDPIRGHQGWVSSIAFSPDDRFLATGSWDRTVRLWSRTGEAMGSPQRGHESWVTHLCFSSDGVFLSSFGEDGTECRWRAGTPEVWLSVARQQLGARRDTPDLAEFDPSPPTTNHGDGIRGELDLLLGPGNDHSVGATSFLDGFVATDR